MHVTIWPTPPVHRSSVSNMPRLCLTPYSDFSTAKSQSSKSVTEKSDNSIHTKGFTNAVRLSCAEHPPILHRSLWK